MKINVKIIDVEFGFFKNKQQVLSEVKMDSSIIPHKHDKMFLNCGEYKVLQTDYIYDDVVENNELKLKRITLFVEKLK